MSEADTLTPALSREREREKAGGAIGQAKRFVIVGAGPAGLTAAYELAKRGATSTVFETDTVVRAHRKAARREATLATGIRRSASFLEDLWRSRSDVTPTN